MYAGGITFDIRRPSQDRYGRLCAEITAKVGDDVANQARIDILDQRQRVDFHAVAHAMSIGLPSGFGDGVRGCRRRTPGRDSTQTSR
jgi:hypothetical protein